MKIQYFNKWEFEQAKKLVDSNPYEAKIKYEEYLKKYPKDYSAYPYYTTTLITLGELNKAEEILEHVISLSSRDHQFNNDKNKSKLLERNILANKIKILSYQGKFEELYRLYQNNYLEIESMDLNHIIFYCMKQLNKVLPEIRERNSYLFRQIIEYKQSDFLEHIKKHLQAQTTNVDHPNKAIFSQDFPIEKILEEIKKYIPSNKRIYYGFYENIYTFKYNNCGRNNGKLVDYFKVICFHNTSDIITIYPSSEGENLPFIDLNYLKEEKKDTKVKRLSQIDKFNQRYKYR